VQRAGWEACEVPPRCVPLLEHRERLVEFAECGDPCGRRSTQPGAQILREIRRRGSSFCVDGACHE
jgi:hypothetical protein